VKAVQSTKRSHKAVLPASSTLDTLRPIDAASEPWVHVLEIADETRLMSESG
jgi:hypothetical protein